MGSKKIEVSKLGHIASTNIRAQLGIRRMSNRELARQMDRSESYVRARVNDEKEWTLNDLEIICRLWHLQPSQLVVEGGTATPTADDLADRIVADPESFDLAASTNPDKENEMNTPRE